ncbi:MAG: sulfurtransferase TusA [Pseudomonadales bacterium]|nr:sulfurtransferase TusA [Pseudomonadales bacterium]
MPSSDNSADTPRIAITLDATGLMCPEPIMLLHQHMRKISVGDALYLTATDPATVRDVEKFCRFLGHQLWQSDVNEQTYRFTIIKAESAT